MRNDQELVLLERYISIFLRLGVILSAVFLAFGWVGQLIRSGDILSNYQSYRPEPLPMTLSKALAEHDYPMIMSIIGLGVLVSLPILRVLLTAALFIKQRDTWLAAMALFVFAVLAASFFLGIDF